MRYAEKAYPHRGRRVHGPITGQAVRLVWTLGAVFAWGPAPSVAAQEPWFIPAPHWACLLPLDGIDCTGGGTDGMLDDWTAPWDVRLENPFVGTQWDTIDFGGSARSAGFLGPSPPTFVRLDPVAEPGVVDFRAYLESQGYPTLNVLAVAVTYIENTTGGPLPARVCVASDDSVQVWISSQLVLNRSVCRPLASVCDDTGDTVFAPGVHRITVLVWQGVGGHAFRLGLLRPDGTPFRAADPEIRYLPATGPVSPVSPSPFLTRAWSGADAEIPGPHHRISLTATGNFRNNTQYEACELIRGAITPSDVSDVSPSANVAPWDDPRPATGLFHDEVVGAPCSPDNTTSFDGDLYTIRATTGGDIWLNGDAFEFAFAEVRGDFDVSAEIVAKRFPPTGRWGKFGLMVRQSLDPVSRFGHIEDHGPDLRDAARYARRVVHLDALSTEEPATTTGLYDPNNARSLTHPRFLRLTRRGNRISGWVSESAGLRGYDPRADRNWVEVFEDEWIDAPDSLYLGFAYSVHGETSGCATGEIDWRLLEFEPLPEAWPPVGVKICWTVSGARLNAEGLRYAISGPRGQAAEISGFVDAAATGGPTRLWFQEEGTEDAGALDSYRDIGDGGPCSPGSLEVDDQGTTGSEDDQYSLQASGRDIWSDGDEFGFAFQQVTGDFSLRARFLDVRGPDEEGRWGKYGLMARWNASPTAAYFFVHDSAATNMDCDVDGPRTALRPREGALGDNREPFMIWWQDVFGREPLAAGCEPIPEDLWANDLRGDRRNLAPFLRLVRRGSSFFGYGSDDGESWVSLGACGWPHVPDSLLVGIAATSHSACRTVELTFDRVILEDPEPIVSAIRDPATAEWVRVAEAEFDDDQEEPCPRGWICSQWGTGTFHPQIVDGRLRLADMERSALGNGRDTATAAFLDRTVDSRRAFLAEFDAYFAHDPRLSANGTPPGDGLTFCMLGTATGVEDLDLRVGDAGSGLGFARIGMSRDETRLRSRTLARNGFAVELDVWHSDGIPNEGDGANVSGGWDEEAPPAARRLPYHVALNGSSSVDSVQRNQQIGVRDEELPNLFDSQGVHVRILYDGGQVRVWVRPGKAPSRTERLVIDAVVEPIPINAEQAIVGFTAGTGSATCTMEIDEFELYELRPGAPRFHRGDANDSGSIDISDAIFVLNYLFLGGAPPPCREAANPNDDRDVDITDGIYLLNFLFLGGPPPTAPGPPGFPCGPDPNDSPSDLGCAKYQSCP